VGSSPTDRIDQEALKVKASLFFILEK